VSRHIHCRHLQAVTVKNNFTGAEYTGRQVSPATSPSEAQVTTSSRALAGPARAEAWVATSQSRVPKVMELGRLFVVYQSGNGVGARFAAEPPAVISAPKRLENGKNVNLSAARDEGSFV